MKKLLLIIAVLLLASRVDAAAYTFGASIGNWSTSSLWTPSTSYPGNPANVSSGTLDTAVLNSSSGTTIIDGSYSLNSIAISNSAMLLNSSGTNVLTLSASANTANGINATTGGSLNPGLSVTGGSLTVSFPFIGQNGTGVSGGSYAAIVSGGTLNLKSTSVTQNQTVLVTGNVGTPILVSGTGSLQMSANAPYVIPGFGSGFVISVIGSGNLSMSGSMGLAAGGNWVSFNSFGLLSVTGTQSNSSTPASTLFSIANCGNGSSISLANTMQANNAAIQLNGGSLTWIPPVSSVVSIQNSAFSASGRAVLQVSGGTLGIPAIFSTSSSVTANPNSVPVVVAMSSGQIVLTGTSSLPTGKNCWIGPISGGTLTLGTSASPLNISNSGSIAMIVTGVGGVVTQTGFCTITNSTSAAQAAGIGFTLPVTPFSSGGTGTLRNRGILSGGAMAVEPFSLLAFAAMAEQLGLTVCGGLIVAAASVWMFRRWVVPAMLETKEDRERKKDEQCRRYFERQIGKPSVFSELLKKPAKKEEPPQPTYKELCREIIEGFK